MLLLASLHIEIVVLKKQSSSSAQQHHSHWYLGIAGPGETAFSFLGEKKGKQCNSAALSLMKSIKINKINENLCLMAKKSGVVS